MQDVTEMCDFSREVPKKLFILGHFFGDLSSEIQDYGWLPGRPPGRQGGRLASQPARRPPDSQNTNARAAQIDDYEHFLAPAVGGHFDTHLPWQI